MSTKTPGDSFKKPFRFFLCPQGTVFATDDVTALVFLMVKVASLKKHLV